MTFAEQPDPMAVPRLADISFDDRSLACDLTSLLALPSFWGGTEPQFVMRTFFEALESLLALDVCYGVTPLRTDECLQMLRAGGRPVSLTESAYAPVIDFAQIEPAVETVRTLDVGGEGRHCVRLPIGYVGEMGRIVVGASRSTFPNEREITTLRAALSLAASGLQTARLIRERDDAQRAKDEFLAMLGHELRNPLAPIVTSLHLMKLKSGGIQSPERDIIERQVKHLRTLVDDLLDIARVTKGKIELRMEIVDLGELIKSAVETVSPLIEACKHDIRVRVPLGLTVEADPQRMNQVVGNLLTNAAKYTLPGGRIEVVVAAEDGWVTIRIIDSGVGLSIDLMPHVFDAFVQGRQNLARSGGGLGIGLAVVKHLVRSHGGTVSAHSDGPGRGSEFRVSLPAITAVSMDRVPALAVSSAIVRTQRALGAVLIVDDNHDSADSAASVLANEGHRVATAYSGLEALEKCSIDTFDVVLLDIGLPDIDGYRVAAELRTQRLLGRCRVVALTGYGHAHDYARSAQVGFDAHLVKPIEPKHLVAVVRAAMYSDREEDHAARRQLSV